VKSATNIYVSNNIIRVIIWRRMRGAAYVKLEMEKQLGKPRHKWEFNVNMKFDITVTAGFTWLSIRFSGGFL
jgi:hypothetical protein